MMLILRTSLHKLILKRVAPQGRNWRFVRYDQRIFKESNSYMNMFTQLYLHYTLYSIQYTCVLCIFFTWVTHSSPTWWFEVLDSRLNSCRGRRRSTSSMWCPRWPRFFLQQKTAAHEVFFLWKEWVYGYSFSRILYRWWFQKNKKVHPLFGEDFPFLTNMFQLGGGHQLIRWIFLRNVEVGWLILRWLPLLHLQPWMLMWTSYFRF